MNPLYEPFPDRLEVGGRMLPIKTDFRAVLKMIESLELGKNQEDRMTAILGLYKEMPDDLEGAIRAVADFIEGDREKGPEEEGRERKKTLSYKKDAPYIIGDFLRFYGIDLTSCRHLHWQKFQTLLVGLSEDSEIKKRIVYRCVDTGKIKDRHERERIRRIQRAISVEDTEADAGRIGELFGGLM